MSAITPKTLSTPPQAEEAAAVAPVVSLRTEHRDWLFVGYARVGFEPDDPANEVDIYCEHPAEVAAFVTRWVARHRAYQSTPRLWLVPRLQERFTDAMLRTGIPFVLDPVPPAHQHRVVAIAPSGACSFADGQAPPAWFQLDDEHDNIWFGETVIEHDVPLEGELGSLRDLVEREAVNRLLFAPRAVAGGYIYVVTAHDRARRERDGLPYLRAVSQNEQDDIDELVPMPIQRRGMLPLPAAEVWAYFRQYHKSRAPECAHLSTLPTQEEFAAFIKQRRLQDAPPTAPPPDVRLAEKVELAVGRWCDEKARGPTLAQVVKKVGKRREAVRDALDWLIKNGKLKLGPRGPRGEHEYLPA